MQSVCSKATSKDVSGGKSKIILVKFDGEVKMRKRLLKRSIETSESEESDSSDDYYEDCIPNSKEPLQIGGYVKVKNGLFKGLYTTIIDTSYGDESEIRYFELKFGKWVLKDGDIDLRLSEDLLKVNAVVDVRSQYTFSM